MCSTLEWWRGRCVCTYEYVYAFWLLCMYVYQLIRAIERCTLTMLAVCARVCICIIVCIGVCVLCVCMYGCTCVSPHTHTYAHRNSQNFRYTRTHTNTHKHTNTRARHTRIDCMGIEKNYQGGNFSKVFCSFVDSSLPHPGLCVPI